MMAISKMNLLHLGQFHFGTNPVLKLAEFFFETSIKQANKQLE